MRRIAFKDAAPRSLAPFHPGLSADAANPVSGPGPILACQRLQGPIAVAYCANSTVHSDQDRKRPRVLPAARRLGAFQKPARVRQKLVHPQLIGILLPVCASEFSCAAFFQDTLPHSSNHQCRPILRLPPDRRPCYCPRSDRRVPSVQRRARHLGRLVPAGQIQLGRRVLELPVRFRLPVGQSPSP